jgi:RNA polymerase sigma-70 factor (ECF subfamily)
MLAAKRGRAEERLKEKDDEESVRAFRSGDRRAFEELARTHRSRIFEICYRYAGNRADAEDLVQEVLVRVYRGLESFRGERGFAPGSTESP